MDPKAAYICYLTLYGESFLSPAVQHQFIIHLGIEIKLPFIDHLLCLGIDDFIYSTSQAVMISTSFLRK